MFIDIRKAIPNSTSGVEECPLKKFPFLCKESQQCLYKAFVCDGHIQCDKGEDESLELCKEKHAFAKDILILCLWYLLGLPSDSLVYEKPWIKNATFQLRAGAPTKELIGVPLVG